MFFEADFQYILLLNCFMQLEFCMPEDRGYWGVSESFAGVFGGFVVYMCLCMFVCKYLRVLFEGKYENWETYVPDLDPWNGRQLSPRFVPSKGPPNCAPCAPLHCGHSARLRVPHPMCDSVHTMHSMHCHYTLKAFISQLKVHKSSSTRGKWVRFVA